VIWPLTVDTSLIIAVGAAVLLIAGEAIAPARSAQWKRWPANLALGAVTIMIGRMASIIAPLSIAIWAERQEVGLFNIVDGFDTGKIILTIIIMDMAIYWQHRLFHKMGWMWRWHKLHHADRAMDISTGVRFHPLEIVISLVWKSACALALGAPAEAVPLVELWLMLGSLIEHSNIRLPQRLESFLRYFWVTPALHMVHHSAHSDDAHHNFGFAIGLWDHLFGTYRPSASGPVIGLAEPISLSRVP
jgi:sterol desaturase/sphingolipid hydroxylase (fatty acid hydroxylase superfamily)